MGEFADRVRSLELAVEGLARVVFVSGAGDDATPTDLIVGATIHGGTHKVKGTHRDSDGDLLRAHLKHLYTGRSTILDPSEDADAFITADTDTANQVGQRLLSGEKPQMAPTVKQKDSLRQPEDKR